MMRWRPQEPNSRAPAAGGAGSDLAQISSLSSFLSAGGAGWAAKVTELSSAVASGRYQVDAAALSGNLIDENIRAAA